jgi:hypothetical protein
VREDQKRRWEEQQEIQEAMRMASLDQRKAEVRDLGQEAGLFLKGLKDGDVSREERGAALTGFVLAGYNRIYETWKENND